MKLKLPLSYLLICLTLMKGGFSEPSKSCDANLMTTPANLAGAVEYNDFETITDFVEAKELLVKRNKDGLIEINNDFGVVGINNTFYSLYRLVLVRESETQVLGKKYPLEMQVYGNSKDGQTIVVSLLFDTTKEGSNALTKLGIGNYRLEALWKEHGVDNSSPQTTIRANFGLGELIRAGSKFYQFKGHSTEYPCQMGKWLILNGIIGLSNAQLSEIPKTKRFSMKSTPNSEASFIQNFDKGLKELGAMIMLENNEKPHIINQIGLPENFISKLVFNPRYKPSVGRKITTGNETLTSKNNSSSSILASNASSPQPASKLDRDHDTIEEMFSTFEIYYPPGNVTWGSVPLDAVMPWEVKARLLDNDKYFIMRQDQKIPSPIHGFKYIALFYSKTSSNQRTRAGRFIYIPSVVLVRKEILPLRMPTTSLTVYNPSTSEMMHIRILRSDLKKKDDVKSPLLTADEIMKKASQITSIGSSKPIPTGVKMMAQNPFDKSTVHKAKALNIPSSIPDADRSWYAEQLVKKKEKEVEDLSNKMKENDLIIQQMKNTLKPGEEMPEDGGYGIEVPKQLSKAEQEIARLQEILDSDEEKSHFIPDILTPTSNYPLTELQPGQIPKDGVLVSHTLPNNSVILNMRPPISPVVGSKYIVYFYAPSGYKNRWGKTVYVPNYLLVPKEFGISIRDLDKLDEFIPVILPTKGKWGKFHTEKMRAGMVSIPYTSSVFDRSITTIPKSEKNAYILQEDFNLLIWHDNSPAHEDDLIIKRNKKEIESLLKKIGTTFEHS